VPHSSRSPASIAAWPQLDLRTPIRSEPGVLVAIGANDPFAPLEQRTAFEAEMRDGKVDWQMNLYGGVGHSFTNQNAD